VKRKDAPLEGTYSTSLLAGDSPDAYNDIEPPDREVPEKVGLTFEQGIPAKVKNTPKWKFAELPRQACSRRRTEGILPDGAEVAPGLRCVLNLRGYIANLRPHSLTIVHLPAD